MLFIFNTRGLTQVPIGCRVNYKVRCISKPRASAKLTIGKRYTVNELSIFVGSSCRVQCDTGRNVWYNKKHFKEIKSRKK